MKERIMAQRILTGMAMVVAAAAVFACFVLWRSTQDSRAEQAELMQSQREIMSAMLAELKSSQKSDGAQWQTLRFRLLDEHNRPVAGLVSCADKEGVGDNIRTGKEGLAEFYLPPGNYHATVIANGLSTGLTVMLPPGRTTERTIVCPTRDSKTAPLRFEVGQETAPLDLNVYYIAQVQLTGLQFDNHFWNPAPLDSGTRFLLDPQGRMLGQLANVPVRAASYSSSVSSPNVTTFPARLPAGVALTKPAAMPLGNYIVNLAPYVPAAATKEAATNLATGAAALLPGPPDAPALRSVWWAGACVQLMVDTATKDFNAVLIDDAVLNWKNLRKQIADGPMEDPQLQSAYQPPPPAEVPTTTEPATP
jgi:hypothetical protein